ncbi:MAG: YegS/Rv2252/BmrU family lipid kinase [Solobacterium sp.]|nr:YegS/Rv2252/BmrU family lipid kinase [Solobacterium sp.]
MKRAVVLLNGKAGNNYGKRNAFRIIEKLNAEGYATLVVPVGSKNDVNVEEILKNHELTIDVVVCVGGDGTLHHTINHVINGVGGKTPILYLPCGTTNDFARSLGIEVSLESSRTLVSDNELYLDAGLFNQEYFTYVAGFGALTEVSYSTSQDVKNVLGYTAYTLNSISSLPSGLSTKIKAVIDGDDFHEEGEYLYGSVSNCYSIAGIQTPLLKDVELDDGLFEVALIKAPKNISELMDIAHVLVTGELNSKQNRFVRIFHTTHVSFTFEENVEWTLDGEFGGETTYADISVKQKQIHLIRPL